MALDDKVGSNCFSIAYNELSNIYDKLCKVMVKLKKKNKSIKEMMLSMNVELDDFKNEYIKLKESHDRLDKDNDFLRYENEKLREENEKLCKAHKELSNEVAKVRLEMKNDESNDKCIKELEELRIENEILKSSLENANKTISKFIEGEKNLNMLLSQQKLVLDKGGIGYKGKYNERIYRSYFVKATYNTYNYCGKEGHIAHTCAIKNNINGYGKRRYVWFLKG